MIRASMGKAYRVRFVAQRRVLVGKTKVTSKSFAPGWSFCYVRHYRRTNYSSLIK